MGSVMLCLVTFWQVCYVDDRCAVLSSFALSCGSCVSLGCDMSGLDKLSLGWLWQVR